MYTLYNAFRYFLVYTAGMEHKKVQLKDLPEFVKRVLGILPHKTGAATIMALSGNLGSGKTTFTQALARELGVTEVVQSPTYVLMKSYPITSPVGGKHLTKLIHIDAYRLEAPEQFADLRAETFLNDPTNLVVVEWPEKVEGVLPAPDLVLNFSADPPVGETGDANEGERYIGGV